MYKSSKYFHVDGFYLQSDWFSFDCHWAVCCAVGKGQGDQAGQTHQRSRSKDEKSEQRRHGNAAGCLWKCCQPWHLIQVDENGRKYEESDDK